MTIIHGAIALSLVMSLGFSPASLAGLGRGGAQQEQPGATVRDAHQSKDIETRVLSGARFWVGQTGPTGPIFSGPQQYPFVCATEPSGLGQPQVDNQNARGIPIFELDAAGNKTDRKSVV